MSPLALAAVAARGAKTAVLTCCEGMLLLQSVHVPATFQAALDLVADQMAGSGAALREGQALLARMHLSHNALPENAFNALPATAQRCARSQRRLPVQTSLP